jgi:hypothetical protein
VTDRLILGVVGVLCAAYVVFGGKLAADGGTVGAPAPRAVTPTPSAPTTPKPTTATTKPAASATPSPGQSPTIAQMPAARRPYAKGLLTSADLPTAARFRADRVRRTPQGPGMLAREFSGARVADATVSRITSITIPLDTVAHAKEFFRRPFGMEKVVRAEINSHFDVAPVTGAVPITRRQISRRADVILIEVTYAPGQQGVFAFARTNTTIVGVGVDCAPGALGVKDLMPLLIRAVKNTGSPDAAKMMAINQPD